MGMFNPDKDEEEFFGKLYLKDFERKFKRKDGLTMNQRDIEWIKHIVRSSGIATRTQRDAICQRIQDRFDVNKGAT